MPKLKNVIQDCDLTELIEEKGKRYEAELQELKKSLRSKNHEINVILKDKLATETSHREEMAEKRSLIRHLQDMIMEKEKEN